MDINTNFKNIIIWLAIGLVTIAAFFCNYNFEISDATRAIIWIFWMILVLTLGYLTSIGKTVFDFALEAKAELQKVVWPTRQETVQTTAIVMVMVAVTGFSLWLLDSLIIWLIARIAHIG